VLPLIGLIPLLPLLGFVVCGLFGRRLPKSVVAAVACGSVLAAFVVSLGAVIQLRSESGESPRVESGGRVRIDGQTRSYEIDYWTWLPTVPLEQEHPLADPIAEDTGQGGGGEKAGEGRYTETRLPDTWAPAPKTHPRFRVDFGFRLDPLSAVMILVVTGVGFLIHVYSIGYMGHDPGFARYFAYLNLFTAMMLTLVLGSSFLVMFVGWEGVGLCSYLLIGFWFSDEEKAQAGRKAFITNRIGDFAFIVAMLAIVYLFGTLDIASVMAVAPGAPAAALTLIALALFFGACGKSAQIPLYVWLPDAMAGPTPVSALIHAATMVTAGVYMVARCSALFVAAPGALTVVAVTGATTALFAASIGLVQNDIKKVLAYSTVSQLGYMFLGAGVGAFTGSIFHLVTHAFFKALLFLGAGSVIHAMSGEQDMRRMGGLKEKLPWTYWTMLVGALAIAGIPPFAGFFSKDEMLWKAWEGAHPVLWVMGGAASAMTAFYMFRLIFMTFHGSFRGTEEQRHHLHESPLSMTVPLAILAVLSTVGGFIDVPGALGGSHRLDSWLGPAVATAASAHGAAAGEVALAEGAAHGTGGAAIEYLFMVVAVAIAVAGILAAYAFYSRKSERPARAASASGLLYPLLLNKYWVDELYDATVLRAYYGASEFFSTFDKWVVDGLVNAVAGFTELVGQALRLFQTGFVRNYALWIFVGAVLVMWMLGR
jgi:NADH-quinone oxidoreductase subunit L